MKICPGCEKEFEPEKRHPHQMYCSISCGRKARYVYGERKRIQNAIWRAAHRKQEAERVRRWEKANRDKLKQQKQLYQVRHPEAQAIRKERRRSRKARLPATLTTAEWKKILMAWDYKCAYCGKSLSNLHREHFVPVTKGGGFTKENIVPACPTCNKKKCDKHPIDFISGLQNGLVVWARVQNYFASLL